MQVLRSRWGGLLSLAMLVAAVWLGGCASAPGARAPASAAAAVRDGVEPRTTPDLSQVPDAEPTVEPIRAGGPNKPYEVLGQSYVPLTQDQPYTQRGLASWYGRKFHGRRTASGEVYNMYAMTAAHPTWPIPSYVRVRNPANGREVVLRINDRGPFHGGRIIDLSYAAAVKLDVQRGVAPVELARITFDDIRSGAWRRAEPSSGPVLAVAAPVVAPEPVPNEAPVPPPAAAVLEAPAARAYTQAARGFWVQLGAFRDRDGAQSFHARVTSEIDALSPLLAVFNDAPLFRLQAGPYPSRAEANVAAERVRDALQLVPMIVERK